MSKGVTGRRVCKEIAFDKVQGKEIERENGGCLALFEHRDDINWSCLY